jgi:hypothetical protein
LKFTDPSGENPALWLFVGTTFYLVGKHIQIEATYGDMDNSWKQVGDILTMGGSLFLAAGASSAIGAAFGGVSDWWYWRSIMNETMRASAHGYFSWIQAHTMGGGHEPDAAFISGFVGSAAGSAVGMTMWPGGSSTEMAVGLGTSTLTSGLSAELSGGDFGKGMVSGVTTMVFNHMAHGIMQEIQGASSGRDNTQVGEDIEGPITIDRGVEFGNNTGTAGLPYPPNALDYGSIDKVTGISRFELWLEPPSSNILEGGLKIGANFLYSKINAPKILITGTTWGGHPVNPQGKMGAFINAIPMGSLGVPKNLQRSINISQGIKTQFFYK